MCLKNVDALKQFLSTTTTITLTLNLQNISFENNFQNPSYWYTYPGYDPIKGPQSVLHFYTAYSLYTYNQQSDYEWSMDKWLTVENA